MPAEPIDTGSRTGNRILNPPGTSDRSRIPGSVVSEGNVFSPYNSNGPGSAGLIHDGIDSILGRSVRKNLRKHIAKVEGAGTTLQQKLKAGEMFGTAMLKDQIARGHPLEARGESLRRRHETNVDAIGGRTRRLQAGANLAAQREGSFKFSGPRGFSRQLLQAEKRGKARQGIHERGDKAIRNQQLKDRISIARQAINKRGQVMQSAADAAQIRAGGEAAIKSAHAGTQAAYAGAAGAIAGGALRGFGDKLFDTGDLSTGMMDQQAEVDSFFGAGLGDVGGIDVNLGGSGFDFGGAA